MEALPRSAAGSQLARAVMANRCLVLTRWGRTAAAVEDGQVSG